MALSVVEVARARGPGLARSIALPIGAVALAIAITRAAGDLFSPTPFALSYAAVLMSAVWGGALAGWLALAAALAGAVFFLLEPVGSFAFRPQMVAPLLVAAGVTGSTIVLVGRVRAGAARERTRSLELERLNRLYSALSQVNQAIVVSRDEHHLLATVCRVLVESGGFRMAWIGRYDEASAHLESIAQSGDSGGFLTRVPIYADERPEGLGPAGRAFRAGRAHVSNDLLAELPESNKRVEAERQGFLAAAALPIRLNGTVMGTLTVYATEPDFFKEAEVELLEKVASDVSFALDNFQREAERREAAADAARERHLVERIFESVPGVVYLYDDTGRLLRWNQNLLTVSGYDEEAIARRNPADFFRGEDVARVRAAAARTFATGASTVEAGFVSVDGRVTRYFFTGRRIELDGRPCAVGVGIDLSDLVKAEEDLRASEERFEIVVEHLREGLVIANADLSLQYWNPAALRLIGFDDIDEGRRRQPQFLDLLEIRTLDGEPVPQERWPLTRVRAGESLLGLEIVVRRTDRDWERIVSCAGRRVDYSDGRQLAFITVQDVTDRIMSARALLEAKADLEHRVEERTAELQSALVRAESADRLKSAFLATMSHELRTPLNSILGFTGIVLQGLAGPLTTEQTTQLGMVRGSARHLLDLINDVLDISKIEAGQMQIRLEATDLRVAADGAIAAVRQLAEQKGLTLEVSLPEVVPTLRTDRRRVHQVLLNLLNNAVKFTERGGIGLLVEAGDSVVLDGGRPAVRLTVSDTGIGITPVDLETLFQPFRQLDSGPARHHEGTGLGLAISRRLAELLGGRITAESTLGVGSRFIFTLPVESEEPA